MTLSSISSSKSTSNPITYSNHELLLKGNETWTKKKLAKQNKQKKQIVFDEEDRNKFIQSFPFKNVEKRKKEELKKKKKLKQERNRHIALKRKKLVDHYKEMVKEQTIQNNKSTSLLDKQTQFGMGNTITTVTISEEPSSLF